MARAMIRARKRVRGGPVYCTGCGAEGASFATLKHNKGCELWEPDFDVNEWFKVLRKQYDFEPEGLPRDTRSTEEVLAARRARKPKHGNLGPLRESPSMEKTMLDPPAPGDLDG